MYARGRAAALVAVSMLSVGVSRLAAQEVPQDYLAVLSSLQKEGEVKDRVLEVNIPRNDLSVTIAGRRALHSGPTASQRSWATRRRKRLAGRRRAPRGARDSPGAARPRPPTATTERG
jgi:hypothetical protein